jgi:hypothetical protein
MNRVANVNHAGRAWIVQTEIPNSAHLYELRNFVSRSKKAGDEMARTYGGVWKYVPGHGCRGSWTVTAETPEALREILDATEIPITLYLYPHAPIPAAFVTCPKYRMRGGYYQERV